ncbi:MAG: DUF1684 domain-containing protein [Flammeovirgaceae bacterium]|nr:DUF1684 domain-containing protein [Flammeovirgaceae bacterium]
MSTILKGFLFSLFVLATVSCTQPSENKVDRIAYANEINQWHSERIDELKSEKGWLNLAGLYWLKEGINTFGSDESNDIVFPAGKIDGRAGYFLVKNGVVEIHTLANAKILVDSSVVKDKIIFHPDSTRSAQLTHGSLRWFIIKRDDQVGIRLRDMESKTVAEFSGINRYEVDPAWRIEAKAEIPEALKRISITNVLGQTTDQISPATIVFNVNSQTYRLDALDEGTGEWFIIFGDSTNTKETYPAGRYLYVKLPDAAGNTIIDFNKSYNPPCAFTPYATCPLPPAQNVLPLSVRAGEKLFKGYSH